MLIISHTMQDVLRVADHVVVLRQGRKVADLVATAIHAGNTIVPKPHEDTPLSALAAMGFVE